MRAEDKSPSHTLAGYRAPCKFDAGLMLTQPRNLELLHKQTDSGHSHHTPTPSQARLRASLISVSQSNDNMRVNIFMLAGASALAHASAMPSPEVSAALFLLISKSRSRLPVAFPIACLRVFRAKAIWSQRLSSARESPARPLSFARSARSSASSDARTSCESSCSQTSSEVRQVLMISLINSDCCFEILLDSTLSCKGADGVNQCG